MWNEQRAPRLRAGDPAAFSELFDEHAQAIYRHAVRALLQETAVPPATRAGLYRATALIPGVRVVSDSRDALGRKGIAVAYDLDGERTEWVFDKASLAYLGMRDYLLTDSDRGEAGTVLSAGAVVTQKVVDEAGVTE
ncbi:hypothetical protein [Planotetraspora sp. GP83]|uniref:hypothetical protein n=1 Tax=Planotetraspora sp. GP83 TaxID=3156264 RepID=UPI003516D11A